MKAETASSRATHFLFGGLIRRYATTVAILLKQKFVAISFDNAKSKEQTAIGTIFTNQIHRARAWFSVRLVKISVLCRLSEKLQSGFVLEKWLAGLNHPILNRNE